MYSIDEKWKIELQKKGLYTPDRKMGGGRVLLLRATNLTEGDLPALPFTAKIKADGIIIQRLKNSFGVLEPGETEDLLLLRAAAGQGVNEQAREHEVSLYFADIALQFRAWTMGCKFKGEIPNRSDMYTEL